MAVNRPRLCFVAPAAYPVLAGDRSLPVVGGAEVQQSFLASEFVRRGYPVSMICMDYGQPNPCIVDGITVHRMYAREAGLRFVRFLHPRLTSLWTAMRRADADIYYQQCSGNLIGFVAGFSRLYNRLSLYAAASDTDFDPELPLLRFGRDRALFRWGLRHVSTIVVQSERQRRALGQHYERDATVVPSCYSYIGKPAHPHGIILWVANVKALKRPELFLELARRFPHYQFRLVGGAAYDEERYYDRIRQEAGTLPNVEMTGFVPFVDAEKHFDEGSLFVNTSEVEGFPNTFLQAWSRGMPTVSFFDPDTRWQGHPVGEIVGSIDEMATRVQAMMVDEQRWRHASAICRDYFCANHSVGRTVDAYEALFRSLRTAVGARTK